MYVVVYVCKCKLFLLEVQFGAPGSHSDVSVHVRCAGPDRLYPRSQVYVADASRVLLPCRPVVVFNIPFSGGKRIPQSIKKTKHVFFCLSIFYIMAQHFDYNVNTSLRGIQVPRQMYANFNSNIVTFIKIRDINVCIQKLMALFNKKQ